MSITDISRDWGSDPSIVRMVSTDDLAAVTTVGYLAAQQTNIETINSGEFQWQDSDLILLYYATDELNFFRRIASTDSLVIETAPGSLSNVLASGRIFVGSAGNVATGVVMSGDITIDNTGATTIANDVIVNAMVDTGAAIAFSKLAALPSAEILIGSAGNVATATAVTGDVTITNGGVTAIAAGVIVNADINAAAAISFSKLATLASGNILVGSAGGVATSVVMSGDATIIASGALTIANNAVTSAKLATTVLKYATVAITAAEFNGMYAAPKLLVAAGGANTLIVLDKVDLLMTYVSANYAAGGVAAVQYDSTANGAGVIASTTLAAATFQAAASTGFMFNTGVVAQTFSTCVNKGLYLSNITGAFTTGDSTFVAHIWYKIIPTV